MSTAGRQRTTTGEKAERHRSRSNVRDSEEQRTVDKQNEREKQRWKETRTEKQKAEYEGKIVMAEARQTEQTGEHAAHSELQTGKQMVEQAGKGKMTTEEKRVPETTVKETATTETAMAAVLHDADTVEHTYAVENIDTEESTHMAEPGEAETLPKLMGPDGKGGFARSKPDHRYQQELTE